MKKCLWLIGIVAWLMAACHADGEKWIVASQQADCTGVGPQKCLLVKTRHDQDWEFWYTGIEGFVYEPGYEYTLRVKREERANPAADQSSIRYRLVKVISKKQKQSTDLPPSVS